MIAHFTLIDEAEVMDIDIVGFSRGAAQARDFANQIATATKNGWYRYTDKAGNEQCQKVNFRFIGLWDTVLSVHSGSYALAIPDEFTYVAQAVALNEYRGNLPAFPLESIMGDTIPEGQTRIERGFLGSHSDIGGGFPEDDLARVALLWIVDQAKLAGVDMKPFTDDQQIIIPNPVIHDKSQNLLNGPPGGGPASTGEDREVRYMDGTTGQQRQADFDGMSWADTQALMTYKTNPNSIDNISGTVDMQKYLEWLNTNGYGINLTLQ